MFSDIQLINEDFYKLLKHPESLTIITCFDFYTLNQQNRGLQLAIIKRLIIPFDYTFTMLD